jgi:hypothetical protein
MPEEEYPRALGIVPLCLRSENRVMPAICPDVLGRRARHASGGDHSCFALHETVKSDRHCAYAFATPFWGNDFDQIAYRGVSIERRKVS